MGGWKMFFILLNCLRHLEKEEIIGISGDKMENMDWSVEL